MSFDDPGEIERLRLELKKTTAERDHLLVENRRLTQTSQVKQPRATTNELVVFGIALIIQPLPTVVCHGIQRLHP